MINQAQIKTDLNSFKQGTIVNVTIPEKYIGPPGKSAYEVAVENGFIGTIDEWFETLKGPPGDVEFENLTPEQIEMLRGPQGEPGKDGLDGKDGEQGEIGPEGKQGIQGEPGRDGVSPVATAQRTEDGVSIIVTDANGTTTATVKDGEPGKDGDIGPRGESGVYMGTEEPTDPDIRVWLNPDGDASELPSGSGGASDAKDVAFDDQIAGLGATNVQEALERVAEDQVGSEEVQAMIDENLDDLVITYIPVWKLTEGTVVSEAPNATIALEYLRREGAVQAGSKGLTINFGQIVPTAQVRRVTDDLSLAYVNMSSASISASEYVMRLNRDNFIVGTHSNVVAYLKSLVSSNAGGSGASTASDVSFDDSYAGLGASNVQEAIEKVAEDQVGSEEVQDMIESQIDYDARPSLGLELLLQAPAGYLTMFATNGGSNMESDIYQLKHWRPVNITNYPRKLTVSPQDFNRTSLQIGVVQDTGNLQMVELYQATQTYTITNGDDCRVIPLKYGANGILLLVFKGGTYDSDIRGTLLKAIANKLGPYLDTGSSGASTASDISFDDQIAGLGATNVQEALEEVARDQVGSEEVQDMIDTSLEVNTVNLGFLDALYRNDTYIDSQNPVDVTLYPHLSVVKTSNSENAQDALVTNGGFANSSSKEITVAVSGMQNVPVGSIQVYSVTGREITSETTGANNLKVPGKTVCLRLGRTSFLLCHNLEEVRYFLSAQMFYDNQDSGLEATTIKSAIDELASRAGTPGPKGDKGDDGKDYTITEADYDAIANMVLGKLTNAEGVRY